MQPLKLEDQCWSFILNEYKEKKTPLRFVSTEKKLFIGRIFSLKERLIEKLFSCRIPCCEMMGDFEFLQLEQLNLSNTSLFGNNVVQVICNVWKTTMKILEFSKNSNFSGVKIETQWEQLESFVLPHPKQLNYTTLMNVVMSLPAGLKKLVIQNCNALDNDVLKTITKQCPQLTILDISSCPNVTCLAECHLDNVRELYLHATGITDKGFNSISEKCRSCLKVLDISNTSITTVGTFLRLILLDVSRTKITMEGICGAGVDTLQILRMVHVQITSFKELKYRQLRELHIPINVTDHEIFFNKYEGLTNEIIEELSPLIRDTLEVLDLSGSHRVTAIGKFSKLIVLNLSRLPITLVGIQEALGPALKTLVVGSSDELFLQSAFSIGTLQPLNRCIKLEELYIGSCSINNNDIDELNKQICNNLKILDLTNCTSITEINEYPNLQSLNLSGTHVTNNGIKGVNQKLVLLNIVDTGIHDFTDLFFTELKELTAGVKNQYIKKTMLNNQSMQSLSQHIRMSLSRLMLYGCGEVDNVGKFNQLEELTLFDAQAIDVKEVYGQRLKKLKICWSNNEPIIEQFQNLHVTEDNVANGPNTVLTCVQELELENSPYNIIFRGALYPDLLRLDIRKSNLTNENLKKIYICCPNLLELKVPHCKISSVEGIYFSFLQILDISGQQSEQFLKEGLDPIAKMCGHSLEELIVMPEILLTTHPTIVFPQMRKLILLRMRHHPKLQDAHFEVLSHVLPNLEEVILPKEHYSIFLKIKKKNEKFFQKIKNISHL